MRNQDEDLGLREEILTGKRIAILATDGFEESELVEPMKALMDAKADVDLVSLKLGNIRSWRDDDWGTSIKVNLTLKDAVSDDYDGLVLPGGVINADKLRNESEAIDFVEDFARSGKPIAAICHAAWTLIETGFVRGHEMTSWPSLKTDLVNAGAIWIDQDVVSDNGWVTSRKPEDLPAFNRQMIEEFRKGKRSHYSQPLSSALVLGGRL